MAAEYAFTYVMQCPGFLKVGRCNNVARRLRQVQVACPLPVRLLCSIPGDVERQAHVALRHAGVSRVIGEWFEDTGDARQTLWSLGLLESA
jgi:hypothetical protein